MMNEILNIFKKIGLTPSEKSQIRMNLELIIKTNPERISTPPRHRFWEDKLLTHRRFSMPVLITALIIALSGGTAAAANTALPGDVLFPVKQAVENIKLGLTVGHEAKASIKLEQVENRLEEAEKLAVEGKLDAKLVSIIEANFNRHEQMMKDLIAKLEAEGKTEAAAKLSSNLEASLTAHADILAKLKAKVAAGDKLIDPAVIEGLRKVVSDKAQGAAKIREEQEKDFNDENNTDEFKIHAAISIQKAAQRKIDKVKDFIAEAGAKLNPEVMADAKGKIAEADKLMVEGQAKLDAKAYAEAITLFQKAHRTAQAAKIIINSENELKLDLGHKDDYDNGKDKDKGNNQDSVDVKIENGRVEVK